MKIPKKINVAGVTYRIEEQPLGVDSEGGRVLGTVDFVECIIRLDSALSPDRKRAVLMHEIIHAVDEAVGLGFSEEVTDRVAIAVLDVLTRNRLDLNG